MASTESNHLTQRALDFSLLEILSYLNHGEIHARCSLVSREWSKAALKASPFKNIGIDMSFTFDLLDIVAEDISDLNSFELRDLGDIELFEPHMPLLKLWKYQETSPKYKAIVAVTNEQGANRVEGQDMGEVSGLKLNQRYEGEVFGVSPSDTGLNTMSDDDGSEFTLEVSFDLTLDAVYDLTDSLYYRNVTVTSKDHEKLWERCQEQPVREGVLTVDGDVPSAVSVALHDGIEFLADRPYRDYHPGSDNIVRDHVHPGLFPFVKGESTFLPSADLPTEPLFLQEGDMSTAKDRWGRPYEDSEYQWLPTYFDVSSNGRVTIRGEINNLRPRTAHAGLYGALEGLFQTFLPDLAATIAYADSIRFINEDEADTAYDEDEVTRKGSLKLSHLLVQDDLHGTALQVITKIVDYELEPGQSHEGVWHVEGMSHERIIATCLYITDRDEWVTGGDILFKRAFTQTERNTIFFNVGQDRDQVSEKMFNDGLVPLGRTNTPSGRRLCWPNSHIHKVTTMRNEGERPGKRRIVAFFVVDPRERIVSTQEVGDQAETMGMEKALAHRLALMEERKRHKQDWNVRDLSLCEH